MGETGTALPGLLQLPQLELHPVDMVDCLPREMPSQVKARITLTVMTPQCRSVSTNWVWMLCTDQDALFSMV